jgi:8-oxo-dGTP pyrophosphatase MutT (NUDIX family)
MPIALTLPEIRERMAAHRPEPYAGTAPRHAAVATILRQGATQPEVLLIRRAVRQGDPWSGHIAFPGGHRDSTDTDLLTTARRETLEEVGLDLAQHELLGQLDDHPATASGRFMGMVITPFVFALRSEPELRLNHEVDGVLWAPLASMARGEIDTRYELVYEDRTLQLPGYAVQDATVWGLTHRMLENFFTTLGRG